MKYIFKFRVGELDCELDCELEYELAELGEREHGTGLQLEPDEPENAVLITAELNGVDIFELLSEYIIKLIETKALQK